MQRIAYDRSHCYFHVLLKGKGRLIMARKELWHIEENIAAFISLLHPFKAFSCAADAFVVLPYFVVVYKSCPRPRLEKNCLVVLLSWNATRVPKNRTYVRLN